MNAVLLFIFLLTVPFIAAAMMLVPIHIALTTSCYIIYSQVEQQAPILAHLFDPFFILKSYQRLLDYWLQHQDTVPFLAFTAPLIVLPGLVTAATLYMTYQFLQNVKLHFER